MSTKWKKIRCPGCGKANFEAKLHEEVNYIMIECINCEHIIIFKLKEE